MEFPMDATGVTTVVGAVSAALAFLATIANMVVTLYKEARNRRWAQEDKEELAKTTRHTVRETGHAMSLHFEEQRKLLEDLINSGEQRLLKILDKIEENSQLSKAAFKEANSVNTKLHDIGVQIRDNQTKEVIGLTKHEPFPVVEVKSKS
jgi:hypothetical protein